ncbi:MAG: M13 family metallopeptidase [Pseudoflavonifractor sp.]|nr:M13 family metallopeptidase [Alloprevotella sp.]MCM1116452.1 M13 family metallopeptidase [Pseudoflavonifractor sp.]
MQKSTFLMAIAGAAMCGMAACSSSAGHLSSLDKSQINDSIPAGVDFYEHVNDLWRKAHPLTAEYARFGKFDLLRDSAEARVKDIVTGLAATNPEPGTNAYKLATLYTQGMDSTRRNADGAAPIKAGLEKIESAPDDGMTDLFLWYQTEWGSPIMGAGIMENMKNSNEYAMYVSGGSMGMRDRDYYLKDDERNTAVRNAYKKLITDQLANAGYDAEIASRIMNTVMKIETSMAQAARTREESRDVEASWNPTSFEDVKKLYPAFPWDRFFVETMGITTPIDTLIVDDPKAMANASEIMKSLSPRELKDYMIWKYVSSASSLLSDSFSDASFEFNKVMNGVQEQRPRWKRALGAAEGAMGEAVGEIYVQRYFPESSKQYMVELVENLRTALGEHIDSLTWMSDATKAKAREKLAAFTVKIGYPDKFKDYSTMDIDGSKSYFENMHAVRVWHNNEQLAKWGKPVDKTEWGMTPQTVNAYYNPVANEICFPAGILQAPFFDAESSDAENYGGIGVVIGHEMTHGFDDQGSHFDAEGNMTNWWTPEDAETFKALTQKLVDQYSAEEVLPGLHANGEYTLGENIADHGGLRIAMTAFLNSQKNKGVDVKTARIDGFDPIQVFYLNYANLWGQNVREENIRALTEGDVHSLGKLRVNVALRNLAPFFEAFDITEGQPMYRPEEERVIIW